ncbi:MAG: hypothetical protein ACC707_08495 [Thiohalomonadales bacterium]
MTSKGIDKKIQQLGDIIENGEATAIMKAISKALKEKNNFLVARAARWCGESLCYDLIPILTEAYPLFLDKPLEKDKTCVAKRAIAKALYELDYDNASFYLEGSRYFQREPGWGGYTDSAVELRCTCAYGIAASNDYRMMLELLSVLHDPEYQVRMGALRAMEMAQPFQAELAIRHKILQGDEEPEVIAQAFSSLLKVDFEASLDFVAAYIRENISLSPSGNDGYYPAAAIALGESRSTEASEILLIAAEAQAQFHPHKNALFQAMALSGFEAGLDFLIAAISGEDIDAAGHAIEALSIYDYRKDLSEQVQTLVESRGIDTLQRRLQRFWGAN